MGKKKEAVKLGSLNEVLDNYNKYNEFSRRRILVVDDEEFCISSMRAVLYSQGINIEFFCFDE